MRAGLRLQVFFALAIDDAADAGPVDRAGAHRAGFGRRVERALLEEVELMGLGGPGGEQALGVRGAVAAFGAVAVALLAQHGASARPEWNEGMVARLAERRATSKECRNSRNRRPAISGDSCKAPSREIGNGRGATAAAPRPSCRFPPEAPAFQRLARAVDDRIHRGPPSAVTYVNACISGAGAY